MKTLSNLLSERTVVILDSAMGTELESRGADISLPLWSARAILEAPDTIRQIHIDNIDAGADIITTNTFRTQRRTFERANYHYDGKDFSSTAKELTKIAVDIAKEAVIITNEKVLVAGCIAPLEDCYKPELVPDTDTLCSEHYEHVMNLVESGADLLLAETMSSVREISAVLNQIHKTEIEYCISLLCKNDKELFSGELLIDAVSIIEKFSPAAIMINCVHPALIEGILKNMKSTTGGILGIPLGVYANVGEPSFYRGGKIRVNVAPDEYLNYARNWKALGVKIIGGCCGTTPDYIEKISILKKEK
jgi:homocysteine S-methyltransferase